MTEMTFKTIIIDDEQPARSYIKELLQPYSNCIEIIGEATNGNEAVKLIKSLEPDLIFLDIQMPGKNGFEVVQSLKKIPLVVFCTAFDEYALNAFETNSVDYLVKPVSAERLNKTIEKLKGLSTTKEQEKIEKLIHSIVSAKVTDVPTTFPVKVGDRVIFLKMSEIAFFKSKDKYVEIHTVVDKAYILEHSLNTLEMKLPNNFRRVQRAFIININHITEIRKYSPGKYAILLDDVCKTKIITGRSYSMKVNNLVKL